MTDNQSVNKNETAMLIPDKITEIFCIADDFCKEFAQETKDIILEGGLLG